MQTPNSLVAACNASPSMINAGTEIGFSTDDLGTGPFIVSPLNGGGEFILTAPGFYNVHLSAERITGGLAILAGSAVQMAVLRNGGSANFAPLVWQLTSSQDGTSAVAGERIVQVTSPNAVVSFSPINGPVQFNASCFLQITLIKRTP